MTSEELDALMSGEFTKISEAKAALKYLEQCNDQSDIGRERLQKTKEFAKIERPFGSVSQAAPTLQKQIKRFDDLLIGTMLLHFPLN